MRKRRTVLIPLNGPVNCLAEGYRGWALTTVPHDYMVSSVEAIIETQSLQPFMEAVLYEIFKEHHLSSYIDSEPESNKFMRLLGVPEDVTRRLKGDFLDAVVALLYGYLPELNVIDLEAHDYGITSNQTLIMHVPEDLPVHLYGNVAPEEVTPSYR